MKKRISVYVSAFVLLAICFSMIFSFSSLAVADGSDFASAVAEMRNASDNDELLTAAEAAADALSLFVEAGGELSALSSQDLYYYRNEAFIAFVDAADAAWSGRRFLDSDRYILLADGLYPVIDELYPVVDGAKQIYGDLSYEIGEKKELCALFITRVNEALEGETYADIKRAYDTANMLDKTIDAFMKSYIGYSDAYDELDVISDTLSALEKDAKKFINKVTNLFSEKDFFEAVYDADETYQTIDKTVNGVSEARFSLDQIISDYNEQRAPANEAQEAANALIFAFIL